MSSKIKSEAELIDIISALKSADKQVVTTNGSFDIMHAAHVAILKKAKSLGDILVVLVNSDASVQSNKGPTRPIIPENERAEMLEALECVDYVMIFEEEKVIQPLKRLMPSIHAKGGTFIPERIKEEKEIVESWGGEYSTFEEIKGYSTTNIIKTIQDEK